MKLAITGKGGAGKTFISALLADAVSRRGAKVFAVDADPDSNLASALGFHEPRKITPLIELQDVIEERTGARPGSVTSYFSLNPKVDDIPEKFFARSGNISLAVMGSVKGGGMGCVCPESAFLKSLISHLILERGEAVILDMEAGIEHLGRGTASAVDVLLMVVEPGSRSVETSRRIKKLAAETGIKRVAAVGNKIRAPGDEAFIRESLGDTRMLGFIPFENGLVESDRENRPFYELCPGMRALGGKILESLRGFAAKQG